MNHWRDSWEFVSRYFSVVYSISLFVVLPTQFCYLLATTIFPLFLSAKMRSIDQWTMFFACLLIAQVPFILLVRQVEEVGEISIVALLRTILDRIWELCLKFFLLLVVVHFSMYLLFIPGVFIFVLFLLFPYSLLWERGDWKHSLKLAWDLGFNHLGKCIMIFSVLVASLDITETGSAAIIHIYAAGQPIVLLIPPLLGSLVLPVYTVYLSYRYMEWREIWILKSEGVIK